MVQIHHAMLADLLEHVIEESQSRADVALLPRAIKIHLDVEYQLSLVLRLTSAILSLQRRVVR